VLVDLGAVAVGQDVVLYAADAGSGMGMGMGMGSSQGEVAAMTIRVDRVAQPGAAAGVPETLPAAASVTAPGNATMRTIRLDGGMMGSAFTLNGRSFDLARIDMVVPAGATEIWTFTNATMMAHPMHVRNSPTSTVLAHDIAGLQHQP
jgi:bilirubin oxidase